MASKEE